MKIRGVDNNGDWIFGGLNAYRVDQNAIIQHIRQRLYEWKDDCWFDRNAGIDWPNRTKAPAILIVEIKTIILQTDGVEELVSFTTSLDENRVLTIDFTINTIYSAENQRIIIRENVGT